MKRFILFPALTLLVSFVPSLPAHAQAGSPSAMGSPSATGSANRDTTLAEMAAGLRASDEAVRRIVERAMAAVELAEARANREVAMAQIRIADLERAVMAQGAEIEVLKQVEVDLGNGLNASLAEADRYAREAKGMREERDDLAARLESARMELAQLAEWRDTASRAVTQARRAIADRDELSERIAGLHAQFGLSEHALREARTRAETIESLYADTLTALGRENDALRISIGQLQDRIQAHQHRSGVVEESLRREAARADSWETTVAQMRERVADQDRAIAEERAALEMERRRLSDSYSIVWSTAAGLRQALEAEREKVSGLESRCVALAEAERTAREALAGREGMIETLSLVVAERDALRLEIQSTVQVLNDAATALASARAERDEARRGMGGVPASDASWVAALEARLVARDREIASLRQALLASSLPVAARIPDPIAVPRPESHPSSSLPHPSPSAPVPPDPAVVPPAPLYVFDPVRGSYDDLAAIPAVGPTRARAIVWYRENVAPIRGENDLKSVPGFNDDRIKLLRPYWRLKED